MGLSGLRSWEPLRGISQPGVGGGLTGLLWEPESPEGLLLAAVLSCAPLAPASRPRVSPPLPVLRLFIVLSRKYPAPCRVGGSADVAAPCHLHPRRPATRAPGFLGAGALWSARSGTPRAGSRARSPRVYASHKSLCLCAAVLAGARAVCPGVQRPSAGSGGRPPALFCGRMEPGACLRT